MCRVEEVWDEDVYERGWSTAGKRWSLKRQFRDGHPGEQPRCQRRKKIGRSWRVRRNFAEQANSPRSARHGGPRRPALLTNYSRRRPIIYLLLLIATTTIPCATLEETRKTCRAS